MKLKFAKGESKTFKLTVDSDMPVGKINEFAVSVVTTDQIKSDATSSNRSLTDENVEKRWDNGTGPHDAEVKGVFIRLKGD